MRGRMNLIQDFPFLLDDLNKTETSRVKASKEAKVSEIIQQVSKLYAKGRTVPGNIVTNVRGSSYSSQRQWALRLILP